MNSIQSQKWIQCSVTEGDTFYQWRGISSPFEPYRSHATSVDPLCLYSNPPSLLVPDMISFRSSVVLRDPGMESFSGEETSHDEERS